MSELSNDTRGWIMCAASAIACVFGASMICMDALIRLRPKWKNFRIQDSDKFLAACFSLSFGVMLLSAFLDMWPSSIKELQKGEMSPSKASFMTITCFVVGFIGIQGFSRWLHSYMPSHVVDCDHTHEDVQTGENSDIHSRPRSHETRRQSRNTDGNGSAQTYVDEDTPLLNGRAGPPRSTSARSRGASMHEENTHVHAHNHNLQRKSLVQTRRPSMMQLPSRVLSFVKDNPSLCDESGPCKGYTDPCGQECFRTLESRTPTVSRHPTALRTATMPTTHSHNTALIPLTVPEEDSQRSSDTSIMSPRVTRARSHGRGLNVDQDDPGETEDDEACESDCETDMDLEAQHHHHVPQNAYMNIGLQTSVAIGLHKLPEGFIMFATNHANPDLGFNVFFALFIHNITEGFAMALPLYLAFGSRLKAIMYSVVLGGLSQPLGAGIAALWFLAQGTMEGKTGHVVYGCLFGGVSGIMAAVAILLLLEGIAINHNNAWCSAFVLVGFVIFGVSTALRA